jgi:hypothetical protein
MFLHETGLPRAAIYAMNAFPATDNLPLGPFATAPFMVPMVDCKSCLPVHLARAMPPRYDTNEWPDFAISGTCLAYRARGRREAARGAHQDGAVGACSVHIAAMRQDAAARDRDAQ